MPIVASDFELFSLPQPGDVGRLDFARRLRATLLANAATVFVTRARPLLDAACPELLRELAEVSGSDTAWLNVVPTHQAALLAAARGKEPDLVWVAAEMGLALRSGGRQAAWQAEFESVRTARIAGSVSPAAAKLNVEEVPTGTRPSAGWRSLAVAEHANVRLWILPFEDRRLTPVDVGSWLSRGEVEACREALTCALQIVANVAPEYFEWIAGAIDTVVPTEATIGTSTSMSFDLLPGTVSIGFPADPVTLGELLVHEASHLYLALVESRYWLSNQTDRTLYYSPFARRDRPLVRLLVGFHAFANIAAYYDRLGGKPRAAWRKQWLAPMLDCRDCIASSSGLTLHGLALFGRAARLFD